MKSSPSASIVGLIALVAFSVGLVMARDATPSLATLERAARSYEYRQAGYHTHGGNDRYWQVRELEVTGQLYLGVTIAYGQPHMGAVGTSQFGSRAIVISEKLTWNERLEVLAHELGHILMPRSLTASQGEVFAEGVSYLVSHRMGHHSLDVHARYLAQHKPSLHVLTDYAMEIRWAAGVLTPGS